MDNLKKWAQEKKETVEQKVKDLKAKKPVEKKEQAPQKREEREKNMCPECKIEYSDSVKFCPRCGYQLQIVPENRRIEIEMGRAQWIEIEQKIDQDKRFREYKDDPLKKKIERLLVTYLYDRKP